MHEIMASSIRNIGSGRQAERSHVSSAMGTSRQSSVVSRRHDRFCGAAKALVTLTVVFGLASGAATAQQQKQQDIPDAPSASRPFPNVPPTGQAPPEQAPTPQTPPPPN